MRALVIPSAGILLQATLLLFRLLYQQMFLFFLLYNIINLVVFGPLVALLLDRFVSASGDRAIANFDIAGYLLSPAGVGFLVAAGVAAMVLIMLQLSGFMLLGQATLEGERLSILELPTRLGRKLISVFGLASIAIAGLLLAALPVAGLALLLKLLLLDQHDINYYLALKPPEFWLAAVLGALLAVIALVVFTAIAIAVIFALPHVLFGERTARGALRASLRQLKSAKFAVVLLLMKIVSGWLLLAALVNGLVYLAGDIILDLAGSTDTLRMVMLGTVFGINLIVAAVLGFVALAGASLIILLVWRYLCGKSIDLQGAPDLRGLPHKRVLLITGGVALVAALYFMVVTLNALDFEEEVLNVAHRGGAKLAPENTLSAMRKAIASGADAAEIDVQRTRDGVIVLVHDQDAMRVGGKPLQINRSEYDEIRQLDVGAWFAPEYANESIPTLEAVVETAKQAGMILLVEIKSYDDDHARLVHEVAALLKRYDVDRRFVIISLNYDELKLVRERYPQIDIGYLASAAIGDLTRLDADFLAVAPGVLSDGMISLLHAEERKICVWTIDDPETMHSFINRGVDCIITDRPDILSGVIAEREAFSPSELLLLRFGELYR